MKIIDAHNLLKTKPKQINYLIDGLLPSGTTGDIFGPPGEGKSSLTLDLALTVAAGTGTWHGLRCAAGGVVILGGERSNIDAFQRDLHRAGGKRDIDPGSLVLPQSDSGEEALWDWDKRNGLWKQTEWGVAATEYLKASQPALVLLDTTMSVARGGDQLNNPQQYDFGSTLRLWTQQLNTTTLTISHTNQASAKDDIRWRLNYLSRAGGNGLPGSLRWMAGLSRLRSTDVFAKAVGLEDRANKEWLVCIGVSKSNEMPKPAWSADYPAIFEMTQEGSLELVLDGLEVRDKCDGISTKDKAKNYAKESQALGESDEDKDW